MKVLVLRETGYEEACLGVSLSYNSKPSRSQEILSKLSFGLSGEDKFLESIIIFVDVTAPRYWWQEADTYRVGTSKQSQSTMHTISKRILTQEDFQYPIFPETLEKLNYLIDEYKNSIDPIYKKEVFLRIKANLPEGYLQRRIWMFSYKTFKHMYNQRIKHRLPEWKEFLTGVYSKLEHPEFIIKEGK